MRTLRVIRRALRTAFAIAACASLLACAAPATNGIAPRPATKPAPPMSRPLPPVRVATPRGVDDSCKVDADCVVKNVGNCCGAMPACVNKDSPVDPEAVRAQCAKEGRVSACGFRQISACGCNAGHCQAQDTNVLRGPAISDGPVR